MWRQSEICSDTNLTIFVTSMKRKLFKVTCQELGKVWDFTLLTSWFSSFIDADRRHKTPRWEKSDFIIHGTAGGLSFSFPLVLLAPQSYGADVGQPRWVQTVGLPHSQVTLISGTLWQYLGLLVNLTNFPSEEHIIIIIRVRKQTRFLSQRKTLILLYKCLWKDSWTKAVTIHIEMSWSCPPTLFQQDTEKNPRKKIWAILM